MAEEAQGIQNKRLLLVAGILAGVVVIIYNVHIRQVRLAGEGKQKKVFVFTHDMNAGEQLTRADVKETRIEVKLVEGLGNVVMTAADDTDKEKAIFGEATRLRASVRKNEYLQWTHITADKDDAASLLIGKGMVAIPLQVDPREVPGEILGVGDRVNVLGEITLPDKPARNYRIIEGLRVLAIGGDTLRQEGAPEGRVFSPKGLTTYRSVTVEVHPEVSEKLKDIVSHVRGYVWLEVIRRHDTLPSTAGQINPSYPELLKLTARGVERRGS